MDNIQEIENEKGLYKISKVKVMYLLGYGEKIVYMINLDTMKGRYKEIGRK